jgi:hypothetical protein
MSSYHELMVRHAICDRYRAAGPGLCAGALREVSPTDAQNHLAARQSHAYTSQCNRIRDLMAAFLVRIASRVRPAASAGTVISNGHP